MARGALNWSVETLATAAAVGEATVRRFERGRAVPIQSTLAAMQAALEAAGIEFLPDNGGGLGVRLKRRPEVEESRSAAPPVTPVVPPLVEPGADLLRRIRAAGADVVIEGERLITVRGELIPDDLWNEAQAGLKGLASALQAEAKADAL
jgi:transcriptional regulator with XRE-family HTH domain